jgi:hypothetical protein
LPAVRALLSGLVRDLSFRNAREYFGVAMPEGHGEN